MTCPGAAQECTFMPCKEPPLPRRDSTGSERNTRSKNKPRGTKGEDVWTIPYAPVLDVFLRTPRRGRPPGVKLKNTARIRSEEPILDSKLRGEIDITDEFSSQPRVQGASSKKDKTCESASDIILLSKRSDDTEFQILRKTMLEVDNICDRRPANEKKIAQLALNTKHITPYMSMLSLHSDIFLVTRIIIFVV